MSRLGLPGLLLTVLFLPGCSVFELDKYDSFGDWYVGPPGMDRMLSADSDGELQESRTGLVGDRPPIYGHFRLPEVVFQPKGGARYPLRRTRTNDTLFNALAAQQGVAPGQTYSFEATTITTDSAKNSMPFDFMDAGLVEVVPYRTWFSDESVGYKAGMTAAAPVSWLSTFSGAFLRLPMYAFHDVTKLAMAPVAAVYYSTREDEETPAEDSASR